MRHKLLGLILLALAMQSLPSLALTSGQDLDKVVVNEGAMSARERSSLQRMLANTAAPQAAFADPADEAAWLKDMSHRLARYMPDEDERIEFLVTLHWEASLAGIDPQLMLALIQVKSGFNKYLVSPDGARGYTQVMPFWVKAIGNPDHNLFQLRTNLRYGALILRHYIDVEKGDMYRALGRYEGSRGRSDFPKLVIGTWERSWDYKTATARDGFVVELAALREVAKASDLETRATKTGLPVYTDRQGSLTRVRVGPYGTREEAVAASVKSVEYGIVGRVIKK